MNQAQKRVILQEVAYFEDAMYRFERESDLRDHTETARKASKDTVARYESKIAELKEGL